MRHAFGNHTCERNLKDAIKITHELPQTRCMLPYTRSDKEVLDLRSAAVKPSPSPADHRGLVRQKHTPKTRESQLQRLGQRTNSGEHKLERFLWGSRRRSLEPMQTKKDL